MTIQQQLAQQIRDMLSGSNMTGVTLQDALEGVSWQMANEKIDPLNNIGVLVFHINYYMHGVIPVFEGGTLDIRDKYSYDAPPISSASDWQQLKDQLWRDGEKLADHVAKLPSEKLKEAFVKEAYGSYFRNILGIIEHTHYHLGQIVLLKKQILAQSKL
ncbi:MAG: DinB family protein [Flavobacteriaceae bacterium]|nr:DinB family protein [Flavobacteriaceae bacterium]